MKLGRAVALAMANILVDGVDDVLPEPFEIEILRQTPTLQSTLKNEAIRRINGYLNSSARKKRDGTALDELYLIPLYHVLVPKKEAFDYRKIAIISPENLLLFQAVAIMIAEPFERARINFSRQRVFSYRFKPNLKKRRLFSTIYNHRSFRAESSKISRQKKWKYIVRSDIANFYDRINIHRLESTLLDVSHLDKRLVDLVNQILLHWAKRDSYGIPIGSNGSRILAEVALFNVDKALAEAGIRFIRFVDDYRLFAKTAAEAHAALATLIELLDREGLFINTRKSSIERIEKASLEDSSKPHRQFKAEKLHVKEFKIFAGYGGTIPIKYRVPTKKSQQRYLKINLPELEKTIKADDFAHPEQLRDLLYGIIIQGKYKEILSASRLVEMFPQFYPLFVDMLIKNAEHLPQRIEIEIAARLSKRLLNEEFLPEYLRASLVRFVGSKEFFDRSAVVSVIRSLKRSEGDYLGRVAFEAAQNLTDRSDALEIRKFFNRSNDWERRRIIRLMRSALPDGEFRAWRKAIRTYIAQDYFALEI